MRYQGYFAAGLLCIASVLCLAGTATAQITAPITYPAFQPDSGNLPEWASLDNAYIACKVGVRGNIQSQAYNDDDSTAHTEKTLDKPGTWHNWGVSGRYGVMAISGDPETQGDDNKALTFMGMAPCHYFGYWKLRIGQDMRMIGDSSGNWYQQSQYSPTMAPNKYDTPPPDLSVKEPALGRMGPFIRGIWTTTGGNGSEIQTEIRIHLVRDLVKFEYRITNKGSVVEKVGLQQVGDVETGDPVLGPPATGTDYGPYNNPCYAFIAGIGASRSVGTQRAMIFGGSELVNNKPVPRPAVPDGIDYYDDLTTPVCTARNTLNQEDATKPDFVAVGEYSDLYHKDLWIGDVLVNGRLSNGYTPDVMHAIQDMCWTLCWDQKDLKPGETRTIITYFGVGAATSRWTYKPTATSKTLVPDYAVAAVEAPRALKYDSTAVMPGDPEITPSQFSVKAWVNNTATDPGPFDLIDTTATIYLPAGLELVPDLVGNTERKEIGLVTRGSESEPVEWLVRPTGLYSGTLSMYVSFVDNAPTGNHWQQTVVRKIYVPAVKRGVFPFGWNLMHVPFGFNDYRIFKVFNLVPGTFGAKYWDPKANNYLAVNQVKPGQAFWMYVGGLSWGQKQPFFLDASAAIVGEAPGTGQQTMSQNISLARGWNMIGNPFVYPIYWGQVLVYSALNGGQTITLDAALRNNWLRATLFSWNTDKWDYDTTSSKDALLDPWKGYWVYAYQPVMLIISPPVFPASDVTANPGGQ